MALITTKTIVHGNFDTVAKEAIRLCRQPHTGAVSFDFNTRVYHVSRSTTLEDLQIELFNGSSK